MTKLFLKRFNIIVFRELDSNSKPLAKWKEIHYHLILSLIKQKLSLSFFFISGYHLCATAETNPSSWVRPKWMTKLFLKRFNIVALRELDSNPEPLVKLEEIHYHLIQVFLVKILSLIYSTNSFLKGKM